MRIARWGNSLAVRIPASVTESLNLKEGDEVRIHASDRTDWHVMRNPDPETLLTRLKAFEGRLPADFSFDRDEANAR
ncbi:AbrB/MazE/SpoVT family DNA-binding domain-containing protein [Roseospira visakhapatnamensis]|uniref:Antitoxin MazE n=1 Tax=Roseospira visakhapatnamensis TaxID=390880 RepID=A0A7W6WAS1_9PROT|nr:AbrB/MazE/SpoVT family DNA-binding domain-containing protein [Roseospira visakhapatnamensis]MBB4266807.1 antitoxin MazE [Roseospira visakhapatnamensis]